MSAAALAVVLYVVFLVLTFGVRSAIQRRRTGSTGFKGISGRAGSLEHTGGVLFVVALVLGVLAPALAIADVVQPVGALDGDVAHVAGAVLAIGGVVATLAAQAAMGDAWRIGIDASERTTLVTDGPFALVRNPIFAAMLPTALGLALLVPSVIALAGLVALVAALELQTRWVEEPYLLRCHGTRYADYAAGVGRFLPGVGRLRAAP